MVAALDSAVNSGYDYSVELIWACHSPRDVRGAARISILSRGLADSDLSIFILHDIRVGSQHPHLFRCISMARDVSKRLVHVN